MASTSRRYSSEMRERAVRLVLESGRPIAAVAADLGVGGELQRGGRGVDHRWKLFPAFLNGRGSWRSEEANCPDRPANMPVPEHTEGYSSPRDRDGDPRFQEGRASYRKLRRRHQGIEAAGRRGGA